MKRGSSASNLAPAQLLPPHSAIILPSIRLSNHGGSMQSDSPAAPAPQTARRNWLNFIIDHNPCYLLSGLFMLAGCWLLNFALYTKAGDIRKLLVLLLIV